MNPGDTIEVEASAIDGAGAGVCAGPSATIHVVDLLPGEGALIVIDHVSPHRDVAWGHVIERIGERARERVSPLCPAVANCGGCAWQHLDYRAQLEHKRKRVEAALSGLDPAPIVDPVVASPATVGYRNKGKYVVGPDYVLGAYRPRSHAVVDTRGCAMVAPAIDRGAELVALALRASGLPIYDEATRHGLLRYVVIRADPHGAILVVLVTSSTAPTAAMAELGATIANDATVSGVLWHENDATSGAIMGAAPATLLAGSPHLSETVAGVAIAVGAREFLQINRLQAERLYAALVDLSGAGAGTQAIDLYCGVGGISFALARAGATVLGVERDRDAVAAARRAATRAGCQGVDFIAADAADLATLVDVTPDLLVVNPPRKGLDAATRATLSAIRPPTLVYVSCEPSTLGRDLADLQRLYRAETVLPFDLMPGTGKVETLVICRRA